MKIIYYSLNKITSLLVIGSKTYVSIKIIRQLFNQLSLILLILLYNRLFINFIVEKTRSTCGCYRQN